MSEAQPVCEKCGKPAVVHITNEIGQEGLVRHYCMDCATALDASPIRRDRRFNRGVILMLFGSFMLLFSIFADFLGFGRSHGFGWKQDVMLVLGLVLVLVGTLIRVSTLFVMGVVITVLGVLADWLKLGSERGFGYKQTLGTILGFLLVLAGIVRVSRSEEQPK